MNWESVTVDPSSTTNFRYENPLSVVPKEWKVPENPLAYASHRRGNTAPGTGDFIPLWLLAMLPFGNRVFFVLRPNETPESFLWYTGMTVEQAAMFVENRRLIPQILVKPEEFKNPTFEPIRKALKEKNLMTFHANTYETLLWRNLFPGGKTDSTFEHLKSLINRSLPNRKFSEVEAQEYRNLRGDEGKLRPLMPELEKIKSWVAERIAWQYLEAATSENDEIRERCFNNVRNLEERWLRAPPIVIYKTGHFIHYTATPKYYAKYGVTWFAGDEDYQVGECKDALKSVINNLVTKTSDEPTSESKVPEYTDGAYEIRMKLPRFVGLPTSLKEQETRHRFFEEIIKHVTGLKWSKSDADRFLKMRSLQPDATPPEMITWGNELVQEYIKRHWEPMVQNFAVQEGRLQILKLKTLQVGTNLPFIINAIDYIQSDKWTSDDIFKDIKSFWYLIKAISEIRDEYRILIESKLQEVQGVAFLRPKCVQFGGVADTRPIMKM